MLLFGGHDGTRHLADTHMFDFETRIWAALVTEGVPPIPRDSHVSAVHGNCMYVFGGSTGSAMNDLHELQLPPDPATPAKWRPIQTTGGGQPGHRFCHVSVVHRDSMFVFGECSVPSCPERFSVLLLLISPCHIDLCTVVLVSLLTVGGYDGSERLNDFIR